MSPKGAKSFVVLYRTNGRQRRYTLGRYPSVRLTDARKRAQEILAEASKGNDPAAEKIRLRTSSMAFDAYVDRFIEGYAKPRNKSWRETERILKSKFVARWRRRDLSTITRQDVVAALDAIKATGAKTAPNSAFSAIRKLMSWAVERGDLDMSPCIGVRTPSPIESRERVLSNAEVGQIWRGSEVMGYPFGALIQLLILTAQRRSEVASMRWEDIDFDEAVWTISENKSDRPHLVPLTPMVVRILESIPNTGPLLFPARGKPQRHVSGFSKWKQRLDQVSGIEDWRIHDIRRTATTGMARLKHDPYVIDRVLNHANGTLSQTAKIYNKYEYLDEKRDALVSWSHFVTKLT